MISSIIDRAICLVLDKRIDNWRQIQWDFDRLGIKVDRFLVGDRSLKHLSYNLLDDDILPPKYENSTNYPTWWARPNAYNAWKSHHQMILESIDRQDGRVLFLEDDIELAEDFDEVWCSAYKKLQMLSWDMLYLGWYSNGGLTDTDNEYIKKITGPVAGLHGVIITQSILLEMATWLPLGPYDEMLQSIHHKYNCYAIYPSIILQRDNQFSFVEGHTLGKPDRWKR